MKKHYIHKMEPTEQYTEQIQQILKKGSQK